jgi:hypothetical protein
MTKTLKFKTDIEILQERICIKLEVTGQLKRRTKLNFGQISKLKLKRCRFKDYKKNQTTHRVATVHLLLSFHLIKLSNGYLYRRHLMLLFPIKPGKSYTTMIA